MSLCKKSPEFVGDFLLNGNLKDVATSGIAPTCLFMEFILCSIY